MTFLKSRFTLIFVLILGLMAVLPALAQDEATPTPETDETTTTSYESDGFSILVPPHATVEELEDGSVQIQGPEVIIRPAESDFTVSGAAYGLVINTYDNPEGMSSQDWATNRILSDWQEAEEGDMPNVLPVNEEGELIEGETQQLTVGGLEAFQVDFFGGDSTIVNVYVAHDDSVIQFTYIENIIQNNPIAPMQHDIYALLLDSVEFDTAE